MQDGLAWRTICDTGCRFGRGVVGTVRTALAAVFWMLATAASAEELHSSLCPYGCPAGAPRTNDVVVREIYVLSSNDTTKLADWVGYRVTADSIGPTAQRRWRTDPALGGAETLEPDDYRDANAELGTDRGHQAPLASFTGTDAWETTNYLSNITPQRSALNQGAWRRLEDAVRSLARSRGGAGVHVTTGPLYERNMGVLPGADEAHVVPSGYWKIVATDDRGGIRVAAFAFGQDTPRNASHCDADKRVSVSEVERRSGLDFFHALDPEDQRRLENGPGNLYEDLGCSGSDASRTAGQ
ncbi:MAG: DNA/RNA non-specific endonuclease [Gammaproteobacteria bacterium]|nr:DNA/RNA non-specific endonuclease [Gammaproteobacteria bacterium]